MLTTNHSAIHSLGHVYICQARYVETYEQHLQSCQIRAEVLGNAIRRRHRAINSPGIIVKCWISTLLCMLLPPPSSLEPANGLNVASN